MGKKGAEKGTGKWLANKWKSKGLQKLKFFCQLCEKQCRDANGFKCHCESEAHLRQVELFTANPAKYQQRFSDEFEASFLKLLSLRFRTNRVRANVVYNEFIKDKGHQHMNSTVWTTLTDFVKYLGRTGKVKADEDQEGWWITWIENDPDVLRRQAAKAKLAAKRLDDEQRMNAHAEQLAGAARARVTAAQAAASAAGPEGDGAAAGTTIASDTLRALVAPEATALQRATAEDGAVAEADLIRGRLGASKRTRKPDATPAAGAANALLSAAVAALSKGAGAGEVGKKRSRWEGGGSGAAAVGGASAGGAGLAAAPKTALEAYMEEEKQRSQQRSATSAVHASVEAAKARIEAMLGGGQPDAAPPAAAAAGGAKGAPAAKKARGDEGGNAPWLRLGLLVRVNAPKLSGGEFHGQKGTVVRLVDEVTVDGRAVAASAEVELKKTGDVLRLKQARVETLVPKEGGTAMVLRGDQAGCLAEVERLDEEAEEAKLRIKDGPRMGRSLRHVKFDDFCKVAKR